jgi:hypothetical protein
VTFCDVTAALQLSDVTFLVEGRRVYATRAHLAVTVNRLSNRNRHLCVYDMNCDGADTALT